MPRNHRIAQATADLNIRIAPNRKFRWKARANARGLKMSAFVIQAVEAAEFSQRQGQNDPPIEELSAQTKPVIVKPTLCHRCARIGMPACAECRKAARGG